MLVKTNECGSLSSDVFGKGIFSRVSQGRLVLSSDLKLDYEKGSSARIIINPSTIQTSFLWYDISLPILLLRRRNQADALLM